MSLRVLLLVLATLAPSALAAAELGCPAGQRPLVEIVGTASSPSSVVQGKSAGGALICSGGAVMQITVSRDGVLAPGAGDTIRELPDFVTVVQTQIPEAAFAALNRALVAAKVGTAHDCHVPSLVSDTADRITWHGRRGRRNTFTATTDVLDVYLLVCTPEVEALLSTIYLALLEAGGDEGASVLVVR